MMALRRFPLPLGLIASLLLGVACASPVGVRVSNPREVQRYLTRSALTDDTASDFTKNELRRYGLLELYRSQPIVALANLHGAARAEGFPRNALFALAELSFLYAERTKERSSYAATMIYAWALLFPERETAPLDPLDPRVRVTADLYNRALTLAFRRSKAAGTIEFEGSSPIEIPLPFGRVTVTARPDLLVMDDVEYYDVRPVAELEVRGLRNRYRRPGIGAPLAARARSVSSRVPVVPLHRAGLVPLTAVVFIDEPLAGLESGRLTARLETFSDLEDSTFAYGDRRHPLESEPTAALAATLAESRFWKTEMQTFLGNAIGLRRGSALIGVRPYRPGRIPVVFVHGTASSPARWADMINDLLADGRLHDRYMFWTFTYDSGNPIAYSAWQLRDALTKAVERADPDGGDPCVNDMVVLGHSQGGLLTKLTSIDSGDRFWKAVSGEDFESVDIPEDTKSLLRNALFVKPLPFVTEVMFLATPHQGSYLAGPQIVRRLAERLVRLPSDIVRVGVDLVTLQDAGVTFRRIPTSIDNMSPGNSFIRTLSKIPVRPGVKAHSIVAVQKANVPLDSAGDGVVRYESAHVEGVDSEVIVNSPHSGMQAAPDTIEEVRRILLDHSAASRCPMPGS